MTTIQPKDGIFEVKNHHGAIIGELKVHRGAFGLYLFYTQKIGKDSVEQLEKIVKFCKKFEKKHRY